MGPWDVLGVIFIIAFIMTIAYYIIKYYYPTFFSLTTTLDPTSHDTTLPVIKPDGIPDTKNDGVQPVVIQPNNPPPQQQQQPTQNEIATANQAVDKLISDWVNAGNSVQGQYKVYSTDLKTYADKYTELGKKLSDYNTRHDATFQEFVNILQLYRTNPRAMTRQMQTDITKKTDGFVKESADLNAQIKNLIPPTNKPSVDLYNTFKSYLTPYSQLVNANLAKGIKLTDIQKNNAGLINVLTKNIQNYQQVIDGINKTIDDNTNIVKAYNNLRRFGDIQ
jgi:uncharacterized protein YukE